MAKRILTTLTNNIGFKLLAFVLAFLLWLVVYNTEDPVKTRVYTTTVSIENSDYITQEKNKWFDIVNGTNQVSFSVSAKRSTLEKLEESDFSAVADFKNMVITDDGTKGSVRIDISCNKPSYSNAISFNNKKTRYLEVALEDFRKQPFKVIPNTSGELAEGYALGELLITNGQLITVSGPDSVVSQIDKIVATINISGMYEEITDNNVIPVLLDKSGKEIPTTRLKLSSNSVSVYAQILGTREIPLVFATVGNPAEGSLVDAIVSSATTVRVKGSANALNKLDNLVISGDILNIEGATGDISKQIDITEFLPEGISLVNAEDYAVDVTVRIKTIIKKTLSVGTANISVEGLSDDYSLAFERNTFNLVIEGETSELNSLSSAQIKGKIDVSSLAPGTHLVTVNISLDNSKFKWENVTVRVTISVKNNVGENNTPDDATPDADNVDPNPPSVDDGNVDDNTVNGNPNADGNEIIEE